MMSKHLLSADVLAAHLEGEAVLLDLASKRYFRLNATGAAIWRGLEAGKSRDEIVNALLDGFDVDAEVAAQAVDAAIAELERRGLLRETNDDDA
jgi:coenzyme PQQ synthesis protein D (PqqD)